MTKIAFGIYCDKQKMSGVLVCKSRDTLSAALAAGLLPILLVACGGGGSAPVAPKTASLLAISSPVAKQSASGQTLLVFRAALLSSASFPVDIAFTTAGGAVGTSCAAGVDYLIPAAGGISVSIDASANAKGVLSLASGASNRQISLMACPGNADKALTLTWNDGAVGGSALATLRGSANGSLAGSMPLNDTGIIGCASNSALNLACPQAGFVGQDAESGRDASTAITGQGVYRASAFALNKLANAECIQDNVTGLTWEGKTGSALHDPGATYTWDNANLFAAAVNTEAWCGYADWRLPTAQELGGIVDSGASVAPTINAMFANQAPAPYWTASVRANDSNGAWAVDFSNGAIGSLAKSDPFRVRLVRGR
jgi:hypothetical protein